VDIELDGEEVLAPDVLVTAGAVAWMPHVASELAVGGVEERVPRQRPLAARAADPLLQARAGVTRFSRERPQLIDRRTDLRAAGGASTTSSTPSARPIQASSESASSPPMSSSATRGARPPTPRAGWPCVLVQAPRPR
jgi:hypothetical protein